VDLAFDIFQGMGVAAAVGVRPFLPSLAAGALAAGDVELSYKHTDFSFLQKPVFLLVIVLGVVVLGGLERRLAKRSEEPAWLTYALAVISLALGALFFGGELARAHDAVIIGIVAGVLCAAVGVLATKPLLARVRGRLDAEAVGALPLITEAAATLGAVLSIVAPPFGVILLAALLWLLIAGRGRGDQKYAGLRILR
jgi:cell division protein FtsW (lipid II flippase)